VVEIFVEHGKKYLKPIELFAALWLIYTSYMFPGALLRRKRIQESRFALQRGLVRSDVGIYSPRISTCRALFTFVYRPAQSPAQNHLLLGSSVKVHARRNLPTSNDRWVVFSPCPFVIFDTGNLTISSEVMPKQNITGRDFTGRDLFFLLRGKTQGERLMSERRRARVSGQYRPRGSGPARRVVGVVRGKRRTRVWMVVL
jgi:hypothetical protein